MKKLSSIVLLILLASCATQTFSVNTNNKREVPANNPHFSKTSDFFIDGIGQTDFNNAAAECKNNGGVSFVQTTQTFGQVAIRLVTLGIYTPRTMNIYCNN